VAQVKMGLGLLTSFFQMEKQAQQDKQAGSHAE
jgi:hypothetical protein